MVVAAHHDLEAPQICKGYYSTASSYLTKKVHRQSKGYKGL